MAGRLAVELAVSKKISLYGAYLEGAYLKGAKNKPEWCWHVHHEILAEVLTEPLKNRIAYIKSDKPKSEQKTRLKLIKPIKAKLRDGFNPKWESKDKAELDRLHAIECPNCPWNGYTIFP